MKEFEEYSFCKKVTRHYVLTVVARTPAEALKLAKARDEDCWLEEFNPVIDIYPSSECDDG
jgi:hypothetical protein